MQDGTTGEGGIHLLLSILAEGEEQARQLGEMPDDDPPSRAVYDYRGAARRLQCTLGKAVSVAKAIEAASGSSRGTDRSDSPRSADESSVGTAMDAQERQGVCKRRKGLPRWAAKFRVPDANLEATPEDGFSWRKYGQKDILGAKYPRGYYRCTYRATQGCPATKQVQRSDSDMCVFDVTYQGAHTCHQKQRQAAAAVTAHDISQPPPPPPQQQPQDPSMELLTGFKDCLKVETTEGPRHDHDDGAASAPPASFFFPSVPFHAGVAPDDAAARFSSPAESSYFSAPHCPGGRYDYGTGVFMRGPESELGEVVSRATAPTADLSAAGFDSSLYHLHPELDPNLPFAPFGGPYQ
ncbi:transcription factor WRKY19-like [Phragmites australis]|uniref:transcription factor WRKY19-like n=1 Tax=Phragmites australis TaxID=29695 RepID=UPI002D766C26|nr:transcription factor WRKY19-like [Phragmites australis]